MINDEDKRISNINIEIDKLDAVKESLNDRIRSLKSTRSDKINESKKIVNWALVTKNENVKELRDQWLMVAKLIYDEEIAAAEEQMPNSMQPTCVLDQDEIDSLLGYDDMDDGEDGKDGHDLAAEWEAMIDATGNIHVLPDTTTILATGDILDNIRKVLKKPNRPT